METKRFKVDFVCKDLKTKSPAAHALLDPKQSLIEQRKSGGLVLIKRTTIALDDAIGAKEDGKAGKPVDQRK